MVQAYKGGGQSSFVGVPDLQNLRDVIALELGRDLVLILKRDHKVLVDLTPRAPAPKWNF